jgi:hypothetical protein
MRLRFALFLIGLAILAIVVAVAGLIGGPMSGLWAAVIAVPVLLVAQHFGLRRWDPNYHKR